MKRIVISDVHIGSKYFKADELIKFLKSVEYDELILAGDIVDFIKVPVFTERALEIVKSIDFSKKVIYIVGNHDAPLKGFIGKSLFGIDFMERYEFEEAGRKFRVEHGDQYDDNKIVHHDLCIALVSIFQNFFENWLNISLEEWWTNRQIRKRKLRKIWDILQWNNDVDVLIIGHFHEPNCIIWVNEKQQIKTYLNLGDWTSNCTWAAITEGVVRLRKYDANCGDLS